MPSMGCSTSSRATTTRGGCTPTTTSRVQTKPKPAGAHARWQHNLGAHETGASPLGLGVGVALDHTERPPAAQRLDGEHVLRLARRDGSAAVARVVVRGDAGLRDLRLCHRVGEGLADVDLAEDGHVALQRTAHSDLLLERL